MIKAVFFDIDGTLVSFHTHRVSEATRQAIRQLRTQGIKVFIATGRHLQVINNLGDLEFDGYVTLNGSCCYIGRDRVIYRRMIPEIALEHLIKYQEEKETFPCIFVREKDMFINYNNQHTREVFRMLDFPEPVGAVNNILSIFVSPFQASSASSITFSISCPCEMQSFSFPLDKSS